MNDNMFKYYHENNIIYFLSKIQNNVSNHCFYMELNKNILEEEYDLLCKEFK